MAEAKLGGCTNVSPVAESELKLALLLVGSSTQELSRGPGHLSECPLASQCHHACGIPVKAAGHFQRSTVGGPSAKLTMLNVYKTNSWYPLDGFIGNIRYWCNYFILTTLL